jgi:thiol-disulfide isomerase/thioredoxin
MLLYSLNKVNNLKLNFLITAFLVASVFVQAQTSLDTAVSFTVKDVNGVTHRLNEYLDQNKIVVIDFFTITCGPCVTYAPQINASYEHFGCNTSNVIFLGINWGADNQGVTDFGNMYGVYYPEVSGTEGNGNHVVADYGVLSYPTVILIRPDSFIPEQYIWPPSTQHLDSVILSHGGILSPCTTPVEDLLQTPPSGIIHSVFPIPANDFITFSTSLNDVGIASVCALSGKNEIADIPVIPGKQTQINIGSLAPGYYILMLRNNHGIIIDSKQVIIQSRY